MQCLGIKAGVSSRSSYYMAKQPEQPSVTTSPEGSRSGSKSKRHRRSSVGIEPTEAANSKPRDVGDYEGLLPEGTVQVCAQDPSTPHLS
jgi:hypothetical protein